MLEPYTQDEDIRRRRSGRDVSSPYREAGAQSVETVRADLASLQGNDKGYDAARAPNRLVNALLANAGHGDTEFFQTAGITDTKFGSAKRDDPAMVAEVEFDAMMRGDGDAVASFKNGLQTIMANVTPSCVLASYHRKTAGPGAAE